MRGEFSTKDSVSSYHPSYEADFYDVRPKSKKAEGALQPQYQVVARQDTKESLKQEALERLRHVSEYRILQTGFVRVGKYLCLGAVLPPYFLLVRLPLILVSAGSQALYFVWKQAQYAGKKSAHRMAEMRASVQLPQKIALLLKSIGKIPSSAWKHLQGRSRAFFQTLFSKWHWPKISLPSWPSGWKIRLSFGPKLHWPQMRWGPFPPLPWKGRFAGKSTWSSLVNNMQSNWKNAFFQAQEYLQQLSLTGKNFWKKVWEKKQDFFKKQAQPPNPEKKQAKKSAETLRTGLQKIKNWGVFTLEGWKWLLLAFIALMRFFLQWLGWLGGTLRMYLPRVSTKRPVWPSLHWPAWTYSLPNIPLPIWRYTWKSYSLPPVLVQKWNKNKKTLVSTGHLIGLGLQQGVHWMMLSFLMSCIAVVWAVQALDRSCSTNGLRDLGLPFFHKR